MRNTESSKAKKQRAVNSLDTFSKPAGNFTRNNWLAKEMAGDESGHIKMRNKMIEVFKQNRQYLIAKFWKEIECRFYDDAFKVLMILEQYDEILRGENE